MIKLSDTVPVEVLLHSPFTLSKLDGSELAANDIIALPGIRGYWQSIENLVGSSEVHQVGNTYYLTRSQVSPRVPKLEPLEIEFDLTPFDLRAMHMPVDSGDSYD